MGLDGLFMPYFARSSLSAWKPLNGVAARFCSRRLLAQPTSRHPEIQELLSDRPRGGKNTLRVGIDCALNNARLHDGQIPGILPCGETTPLQNTGQGLTNVISLGSGKLLSRV